MHDADDRLTRTGGAAAPLPTPNDPATELAAALAQLHAALAQARSPAEILQATLSLSYLGPQAPSAVALHYLSAADADRRAELSVVAEWPRSVPSPESSVSAPPAAPSFLAEYLQPAQAGSPTTAALLIPELATDTLLPPDLRQHLAAAGVNALAILHLYSPQSATWQGLFTIAWSAPHPFSALEQHAYCLLSHSLTAFVAGQRAQAAEAEALAEMRILYQIGTRLNSATSMHEVLSVLAAPVTGTAAEHARIYLAVTNPDGPPTELALAAEWGRPITPRTLGERRPIGIIDELVMSSPDTPIIIDDVANEQRFGPERIARIRGGQVQALVLLPLFVRGRWLGFASLMWRHPHHFTARERRLFAQAIKLGAVALDNRLHIEQAESAARENQEQRQLLSSILDSLPIGVWVIDVQTLQRRLVNRVGAELASRFPSPVAQAGQAADQLCYSDTETAIPYADLPSQRVRQTGVAQRLEIDVVTPGRSRLPLECIAAPLHDRSGTLDSVIVVFTDLTERKHAIQERLRMQSELIAAQQVALTERSTPVIPLGERILVMPIIGSIDSARSAQIMESLLAAISRTGARVALIDITGVPTVDSVAAAGLLDAARAVRLLGTQVVLTGIRAEVAQTLVKLGLELQGVVTCSTLQAGIAYARKRWVVSE